MAMTQQNTEYEDLLMKIEQTLFGEKLDNIVPILTTLLAVSLERSGMEKKECISYVVNSIDDIWGRCK